MCAPSFVLKVQDNKTMSHGNTPMSSTVKIFEEDFGSTLFPMKLNRHMVLNNEGELRSFVYDKVLNKSSEISFLTQQRVFATKPRGHLRRTVKLDPVAEFFIYDLTYRNRSIFRPEVSSARKCFGYRIKSGNLIPVHEAYTKYKTHLKYCTSKFDHCLQFDIASYFNTCYSHDLTFWFENKSKTSQDDSNALAIFLREINSGRSIDVLPQGLYPCKMIGNEFLKFIDQSGLIESDKMVRFMDDFSLFDNDIDRVKRDFNLIQQLLGQYALNVNPAKTFIDAEVGDVSATLSYIQESLTEIISDSEFVDTPSGVYLEEIEIEVPVALDRSQIAGLVTLLRDERLDESDADRILAFLRVHSDSMIELLPDLLKRFPNLVKHIHTVCSGITDKASLANIVHDYLLSKNHFLEYELFWLASIIEDYLIGHGKYGDALIRIYNLSSDYKIARSKVLETSEQGFGLKEIRSSLLSSGQSDWLSWSSAFGTRSLTKSQRNHALMYFAKGSPMNDLVARCVMSI